MNIKVMLGKPTVERVDISLTQGEAEDFKYWLDRRFNYGIDDRSRWGRGLKVANDIGAWKGVPVICHP